MQRFILATRPHAAEVSTSAYVVVVLAHEVFDLVRVAPRFSAAVSARGVSRSHTLLTALPSKTLTSPEATAESAVLEELGRGSVVRELVEELHGCVVACVGLE